MAMETVVNGTTIIINELTNSNEWLIIIPAIATSAIAYFTIHYAKKSHQRTAMMDVFHMLNNPDTKKTEDDIIRLSKRNSFNNNLQDNNFYNEVRKVWRNYDQIGSLTKKNLIPKKEFYSIFGWKMIALYMCSLNELKNRRKTRPYSMAHFTNMSIECFEYFDKKNIPVTNPLTDKTLKREELGNKIKV